MIEAWEVVLLWSEEHQVVLAWLGGLSLVTFVGSLVAVPILVVQMRADYFVRVEKRLPRTPLRVVRGVVKNVLGVLLLLAGVAMLVLPGQGLLTIVFGLSLIDFPGKRGVQLRIVRMKGVRRSIGWIREKAGKEAVEFRT